MAAQSIEGNDFSCWPAVCLPEVQAGMAVLLVCLVKVCTVQLMEA